MSTRLLLGCLAGIAAIALICCGPGAGASFGQSVTPDLMVQAVKVTSVTGDKVEFCYRVCNVGKGVANLDGVLVTAAVSADEDHDAADAKVASQTLSGTLAASQCIYCCCAGLAEINPPETPYLVVTVDADNVVQESDETNNSGVGQLYEAFDEPPAPEDQPPKVVERPYPQDTIVVKARPAQTIVFEPPHPPNFVFLPQTVVDPRVINMQPPSAPKIIVIGKDPCGIQIPPSLLKYKPDCLCVPSKIGSQTPQPAGDSVLRDGG
jgi:hypothetical protein